MSFPSPPGYLPPSPPLALPPPYPIWWPPPPPPPPPRDNQSTVAGLTIVFGVFVLVLLCVCKLSRENRDAADAAAAQQSSLSELQDPFDNEEQQLRRVRIDGDEVRRPQRVSPTAGLPSFTYKRSVMHKATGGGADEATTCSVCLGAFQTGETVRLLPVCLHLYHVECIDPWLDMNSTCPICRTGTDPTTDGRLHPPVY